MSLIHHLGSAVASLLDLPSKATGMQGPAPARPGPATAASGSADSSATDSSSDTITASDFLTLLVTELKNQDPTSDQDPNAYITQLVGVNSLQQLIAINQDLTPATATASSSAAKSIAETGAAGHPPAQSTSSADAFDKESSSAAKAAS